MSRRPKPPPTPPVQTGTEIKLVEYSEHDFRWPLYNSDGTRYEGCRGCGISWDAIKRDKLACRRPALIGTPKEPLLDAEQRRRKVHALNLQMRDILVARLADPACASSRHIDRAELDYVERAIEQLSTEASP